MPTSRFRLAIAHALVAACALTGLGAAVTGCSSNGPSTVARSEPPSTTADQPTTNPRIPRAGESEGAFIYRTHCAACHGSNGEGNLGPALVGIADRMSVDDQTALVRAGRGRMPAFLPGLSDAQIAAVVDYTRTELR